MNQLSPDQTLQFLAWLLALIEFILALYILVLNPQHIANRHMGALLLLIAVNSLAVGLVIGARDLAQAVFPTYLLAATSAAVGPMILLVVIALLKPEWLPGGRPTEGRGRQNTRIWRWLWLPVYALVLLPILLTFIDFGLGTRLWYAGLDATAYHGGYVSESQYWNGSLSFPIRVLNLFLVPVLTLIPLLYIALRDWRTTPSDRRLAWLLLGVLVAVIGIQIGLGSRLVAGANILITNTVLVLAFAYVAFQQMIWERRAQKGRLQFRLTALILVVAVPLLIAVVLLVSSQAGAAIEQEAENKLQATNQALASNVSVWLDFNVGALYDLVSSPDIVSMDPEQQKPVLETMADAYPHMYLVSTTDLNGINVARNDDVPPKDYSDRSWFLEAKAGSPLTFQTLVGRTSGEPALVASVPIIDASGEIVGVGMFASNLTDITQKVRTSQVGDTGFAYVVDTQNRVVAHPDPDFSHELRDLSAYPPILALREGAEGSFSFVDANGLRWLAHVDVLDSGWGVVVQQQETEMLADLRSLRQFAWLVLAAGVSVLSVLTWLTIHQAFRPIGILTVTATAIAGGELTRTAPIESSVEFGVLARAFILMTGQLRGLIGGLEQQVADRTRDLERRSRYLEASAEVGRVATSILETDELIRQVVESIREQFNLYYVGLFLVDEAYQWAVLQAGTGRAGQTMLSRGHRIKVGEGMIGWSIANAQPRVAMEADQDGVRLATPELPATRSEAALPLRSRGRVLGALTVQHTRPGAFDDESMAVLQTMTDQIAVALDNARLFTESQAALEASRRAYGELSRQAWTEILHPRADWGYRYARQTVAPVEGDWRQEMLQAEAFDQIVREEDADRPTLAIPLKVRDQVVGALSFRKDDRSETWTDEEVALLAVLTEQLGLALESARLYQDTQRRAAHERLTGEVTARLRESLDVETVLKTAAQEVRQALGLPEVVVRLISENVAQAGNGIGQHEA